MPSLYQGFFVYLSVEIDHRTVRLHGAGIDVNDVFVFSEKREYHVRILAPFFRQDLDAHVDVLVGSTSAGIIPVDLAIENDGGCARC